MSHVRHGSVESCAISKDMEIMGGNAKSLILVGPGDGVEDVVM